MALIAVDCEMPGPARDRATSAGGSGSATPTRPGTHRELTTREVVRAAADGGGVRRRPVGRGRRATSSASRRAAGVDLDPYGGVERLRRGAALAGLRSWPGSGSAPSAEQPLRRAAARRGGARPRRRRAGSACREGQLTIQYHGGGGVLTGEIGRLFFRRKDYPRQMRAVMAVQKPWFHLPSARVLRRAAPAAGLYFTDGCPPVELASDEGQRLMLANAAAMNYGFAFRIATYAALRQLAAGHVRRRRRPAGRRLAAQLDLRGARRRRASASCTGTTPAGPTRPR